MRESFIWERCWLMISRWMWLSIYRLKDYYLLMHKAIYVKYEEISTWGYNGFNF